jgi:pimeloyl-ACP methyl ester carboxylesterase
MGLWAWTCAKRAVGLRPGEAEEPDNEITEGTGKDYPSKKPSTPPANATSQRQRFEYDKVLRYGFAEDYHALRWVREDDIRSQLISAAMVPGHFLPLLLRGMPSGADEASIDAYLRPVGKEFVDAICPLTRARQGSYRAPTCIVHGLEDSVVPPDSPIELCDALRRAGVPCKLIYVPGAGHAFDRDLNYGDKIWESTVGQGFAFLLNQCI